MNTDVLNEVDDDLTRKLLQEYRQYDLVFLHPTRQYYLQEDNDVFLKGNDKLTHAFAQFVGETSRRVKLLLVRKGRRHDIRQTEKLIVKLRIEHAVEWLPEMPNKVMRAYYRLPQVVVCDQYNPLVAVLGNIGREASYFGRPLITAFRPWNRLRYGEDVPEHVLAAESTEQILEAMRNVSMMTADQRDVLSRSASAWFARNHAERGVIQSWIDMLSSCTQSTQRG
jgi:glycosyltransferase involved in cell wall biosynthesis